MLRTHPFTRLLWPLCLALLLLPLGVPPQARLVSAAPASLPDLPGNSLAGLSEQEPNDTIAQAQRISALVPVDSWSEQVIGKIGTSSDLDYYKFTLLQPASKVKITLGNLPADYDLVLAADPDTGIQQGTSGIEDITNIGGSLSSIGGSLSSIGGSLSSIGGSLSSIGGSLSSIGGSLSSISMNPGTTSELIDTYLWQPGTYYIAVGSANGAYSATTSYTLNIQVAGSSMTAPPLPAPEVEMRIDPRSITSYAPALSAITTLYITSGDRMKALYPQNTSLITGVIPSKLDSLAMAPPSFPSVYNRPDLSGPPEYGYVFDLSNLAPLTVGVQTPSQIYAEWESNKGNPLYANKVARLIDNVIKAATDPTRGGLSCPPSQKTPCTSGMSYGLNRTANGSAPFPNVKYIVLVGGDNVLPFFRVPDLTTLANEADYATYLKSIDSAGIIDPGSPQGAALKNRMLLTDGPYGTDKPLRFQGFPFYLPDRAVGRLVETPEDIVRYLTWQEHSNSYKIEATGSSETAAPAFVTGYDFLNDEAMAISNTLKAGMGISPTTIPALITGPIGDSWTRSDLERGWFSTDLTRTIGTSPTLGIFSDTYSNYPGSTNKNPLFSLNSHFDHWQILPAVGASSAGGTFLAKRILAPFYYSQTNISGGYFGDTLGYSVGCHSGYNVIDGAISVTNRLDLPLYKADFAQAFNKHAGNWIGNTGYGYGTADGIDYSERLALLLTQELMRDVQVDVSGTAEYAGAPIGAALARAKQRYLRNSASLSAYDAKALTIMTLYGLPFIHVEVSHPLAGPPEEPQIGPLATPVPTESNAPSQLGNSAGRLERTITVTIGIGASDYVDLPRTGSKILKLTENNFKVTDSFVQAGFITPTLRVFDNSQAGLPSLPTFAYDISALSSTATVTTPTRLQVRDVVFQGGEYAPTTGFNPQITKILTETDKPTGNDEPTFTAGAGIWYPDKFFGFSSVGSGSDQRDQLTSTAAQFKADTNGVTGQLRAYTKMVFKVYYIDPNATGANLGELDTSPPAIQSVQISQVTAVNSLAATSEVTVVAMVDKGTGGTDMDGVGGVYVQGDTTWTSLTFSQPDPVGDPQRWEAFIPVQPGQLRVIVSATDKAGNVSYYTAKGTFSLLEAKIFLPLVQR